MTGFQRTLDLPSGWERGFAPDGPMYFINHNERTTTFNHPNEVENAAVEDTTLKKKKRRPSFTETLTRPIFRRSSSKNHKMKVEKQEPKEKRPSSARRSSQSLNKAIKMTVVRRDPKSVVTKSGWLYKQDSSGMGGMKIWRKRWFVLSDFCLFYYKDSKEEEVLGSIVLPSYDISTATPSDKINRKYTFKIEHQGMRTYYISAESYKDMAEWVSLLSNTCLAQSSPSKSGSRKSQQAKEAQQADESDFGFNTKPKAEEPQSPTPPVQKQVANGNNNNAKHSTSSTPSEPHQQQFPRQQSRNSQQSRSSHRTRSSNSSRTPTTSNTTPSVEQRRRNTSEPPPARHQHHQHHHYPQQHDPRTAMINNYDQHVPAYGHRNGDIPYADAVSPDGRRGTTGRVQRHESMTKLGNWVMNQKQRQTSTNTLNSQRRPAYDTASEMSSVSSANRKNGYFYQPTNTHRTGRSAHHHHPPSSGKRYKSGSYNDYMDPTEVASSIMSVPPMFRNNRVMSLPRPRSTQELDDRSSSRRKRIQNSKSTSYLEPDVARQPVRTKSDHNLPQNSTNSPPSYRSSSQRTPSSVNTPRRAGDDVFSPPLSDSSYPNSHQFQFEPLSKHDPYSQTKGSTPPSGYEIRQMDVKGKQGQLRAFAVSMKQPDVIPSKATQNLSNNFEKLSTNETDIQSKLDRLNELDNTLSNLTQEISNLQKNKMRLESSLLRARSSFSGEGSAVELEHKLSKVKSQLSESASRLKDMSKENEEFEREVRKHKTRLLEQLNRGQSVSPSTESQRQLEWELGKVQLMMENLNRNKIGLDTNLEGFRDQQSTSPTSTVGRNSSTKSSEARSPRNVKRISTERRSSGRGFSHMRSASSSSSLSHDGKYHTLPAHGVSHATSVDSLTAATLMRTSRPSSARSSNLHRTKSAAERLLVGSHGNLSSQDPDEIKRIQRELNQNRRRTLTNDFTRRHTSPRYYHHDTHMQVGIDVQMAIKHHRMPKVLQRAKREMQRAEAEKPPKRVVEGFDIDTFEHDAIHPDDPMNDYDVVDGDVMNGLPSPHREEDLEPQDLELDLNVTHQLITPDKVEIPDRYVEYEDVILTPEQEKVKRRKIRAIEDMLARSGQPASRPTVHLAAALAAEAGTVARAVAFQAQSKAIEPSLV
uniref:Pleckstrin homology domain-containing family A member 7-like n=1 Tax=Phallusia mammillata TaxID=59560 RepID=A0A6F9DPL5_9ASCI|nr:pleckstrin homology domain-containing family A member 7-like [Phallusia mammillata]